MVKFSYFAFRTMKLPEASLYIESSIICMAKSFLKRTATPLACDVKLANSAFPPHSAFTADSISEDNLVSDSNIIFAFSFLRAFITFALFGFFPIEFGLKDRSVNLEADVFRLFIA